MNENYYEMLIKNMGDIEMDEREKEEFLSSFNAIKKEAFPSDSLLLLLSDVESKDFFKDVLACTDLSFSNLSKIKTFLKELEHIASNEETLNWITNLDSDNFKAILHYFKPFFLGNNEMLNKKKFSKYNLPIMRIMDYCLKNNFFEKFNLCTERLEKWGLDAYWKVRISTIEECIEKNRNHPEFFFLFRYQSSAIVKKYLTEKDILNLTFSTCEMLISQNILPIELIKCNTFFHLFQTFSLEEQIIITELLEGYDFPNDLTNRLHKLMNKENIDDIKSKKINVIINNILEVSSLKLIQMYNEIKQSSYFKKFNVEKDDFWIFINDIVNSPKKLKYLDSLNRYSYNRFQELHEMCYRYATESIISSLYPLTNLNKKVTYMDLEKYNVLCRVQTLFDLKDLDESFRERTFCGFTILTQDNHSHYPGTILHGYYSNLVADLITHIYPADSLSNSWAQYKKDLTDRLNMFLDIDDLNALTYANKTYNQLCIRTKTRKNEILKQDAIICIENIDNKSDKYAEIHHKKILVLRKNKNTIENNKDIYSHLQ